MEKNKGKSTQGRSSRPSCGGEEGGVEATKGDGVALTSESQSKRMSFLNYKVYPTYLFKYSRNMAGVKGS